MLTKSMLNIDVGLKISSMVVRTLRIHFLNIEVDRKISPIVVMAI